MKFLDQWCVRTMRSKIEPMKKIVNNLREHRDLTPALHNFRMTQAAGRFSL